MARSLRDELLKAGLVTGEQAARAGRGRRPSEKPVGSEAAGNRAAKRRPREAPKRRFPGRTQGSAPAPAKPPDADPEARIRQLNLDIRRILDTEAEKAGAEADTDTPFHFAREDRIKRIYVNEDQRRRLSDGELAIVGFGRRHLLLPRPAGERIRELRPEVFVFIASAESGSDVVEEGYEGYEVPDCLVW